MKLLLFKLPIAVCCGKHVFQIIVLEYSCVEQNKNELKIIEALRIITQLFYYIAIYYFIIILAISETILLQYLRPSELVVPLSILSGLFYNHNICVLSGT